MTTHRFPLFLSLYLLLLFFPSLSLKPLPSSTLSVPTQISNLLFDSMPILITASLLASPPAGCIIPKQGDPLSSNNSISQLLCYLRNSIGFAGACFCH